MYPVWRGHEPAANGTMSAALQCDVAVVGGGPVGAALALALHQAQFDVRLVERAAAPETRLPDAGSDAAYDLRVYAVSRASARFLDGLGVWSAITAARSCAYQGMRVWADAETRVLPFTAAEVGASCLGWIVEQQRIRAACWAALPAEVTVPGVSVQAAQFDDSGCRLDLTGRGSLRARLVVSAEGAEARLRDWAGLETEGWSYGQRAVVCHLHTRVPHDDIALQRFLPDGPLAFLPLADGRRSIVWSTRPEHAQSLLALSDAAFGEQLSVAAGGAVGVVDRCTERLSFPLRLQHAQDYVRGGFALVGDAAHVVHPLAGQGANLGFGDAEALVQTLSGARAQRQDWAGLRALMRYQRARKAANLEMLALTDALNRGFRSRVPGLRRVLDEGMGLVGRLPPARRALIERALG